MQSLNSLFHLRMDYQNLFKRKNLKRQHARVFDKAKVDLDYLVCGFQYLRAKIGEKYYRYRVTKPNQLAKRTDDRHSGRPRLSHRVSAKKLQPSGENLH